jgi:hypothetical protein
MSQDSSPKSTVLRSPALVYALSGLGKSTLARAHPEMVCDYDERIYDAVSAGFPKLGPREALRAWRELCRSVPWEGKGSELDKWAAVRRAIFNPLVEIMEEGRFRLVVTSLLQPPWHIQIHYGMVRRCYLNHLRSSGRKADNHQTEGMNDRLEGFSPLVRVEPGTYLADRPEICALLG